MEFCQSRGQGRQQIVQKMLLRARSTGGVRGPKIAKANADAFEIFEDVFVLQILKFRRSFLRQKQTGCEFEGVLLQGAPHFEIIDRKGRRRHVFLHAAEWPREDLLAYLELLGIVIEKRFGGNSASLWVLDLKRGEEIRWHPSSRVKKRCTNAAKLYARLLNAVENTVEEE